MHLYPPNINFLSFSDNSLIFSLKYITFATFYRIKNIFNFLSEKLIIFKLNVYIKILALNMLNLFERSDWHV